jgi:alpha-amylase
MKNLLLTFVFFGTMTSCIAQKKISLPYKPEALENAIIYEANIRQYSKEGTFNAFTADIPKLKKLGIKIIWLMPIHEVGMKNRKAFGDKAIEQVPEADRSKYYGSHYSVKDYRSVSPNYGTKADFDKLVNTAHQNGMYVILDWVANHTAWDHEWVTKKNKYYTRDKNGKMIAPFDWTDVAELDFTNQDLRKAMIADMNYWLTNHDVDGFRCDVAMEVPKDFWENATVALNKTKPVFMLMEAEQTDLMEKAFDMQYGWTVHHIFNKIYKGENTVKNFDEYMTKTQGAKLDDIYMNFTSNHDENSWNGTEYERMNDAVKTFAALTYIMPGMPLIYNGQEYDLNKRLKFFEKDEIPHTTGKMMEIYEKLAQLKLNNPALNGGKNPATYKRIKTSNDESLLAFEREKGGKKVIFIANLSKQSIAGYIETTGEFKDYLTGVAIDLPKGENISFAPWQFYIFEK